MHFSKELEPQELCKKNPSKIKKRRCLILSGPTAVGKTQLSLDIAQKISAEIISFDSMQVYKGMDIGTAKVSLEQRMQVPHHMIDIVDIAQEMNVVKFCQEAWRLFDEICERENIPILVGGTGFYLHCFLYGPPKGPPSDKGLREKLESDCDHYGVELLYEKVLQLDPDYAMSITKYDRHKIIRALEIMELTHKRVSQIPKPSQEDLRQDVDFRCWFMHYCKPILYPKIEMRCDQMLEMGLLSEVQDLMEKGLELNSSASNSIGYRQGLHFLHSNRSHEDYEFMVQQFKKASKKLAKRQFTWFKKEKLFEPLDMQRFSRQEACKFIMDDFLHC